MNSTEVNRGIRAVVRPILKDHGFVASTQRSFCRRRDRMIDVVNFQSFNRYNADVMGCTTFSFALNLGVYLTDVPADHPLPVRRGLTSPEEYHCQIRRRLHPAATELPRAPDIWAVDELGANLEQTVEAAALALIDTALPWFQSLSDPTRVLAILCGEVMPPDSLTWLPGALDSPARNTVTGYLALATGREMLGASCLRRALSQLAALEAAHANARLRMNRMVPRHLEETVAALKQQSA